MANLGDQTRMFFHSVNSLSVRANDKWIILLYIFMMDPRLTKVSKSIFYRGITLKDYLRKSSVAHRNL